MKIQLKEHVEKDDKGGERRFKQDNVEVANGEYRRVFDRADEPFEIKDEEWPLILRTGEFEPAEETPATEQSGGGGGDANQNAGPAEEGGGGQQPAQRQRRGGSQKGGEQKNGE